MSDAPEPPSPSPPVKTWRFARLLLRPALARKLGTLVTDGYLAETGWVRSVISHDLVDAEGEAVPWMTQPFLDFLRPRIQPHWQVFEYGAGTSTLFFARRTAAVLAVEHDAAFAAELSARLPAKARVIVWPESSAEYAGAVAHMRPPPHLVCVDGRNRVRCVAAALPCLDPAGVLVLDDAERPEYAAALVHLRQAGFRSVEFHGLAPGQVRRKCTAVFYRADNVLGL